MMRSRIIPYSLINKLKKKKPRKIRLFFDFCQILTDTVNLQLLLFQHKCENTDIYLTAFSCYK